MCSAAHTPLGTLGDLAEAFGDPTRRAMFEHVVDAEAPLSASEVGAVFGVHRTVARSHLEKLVAVGLLNTSTRRREGGGRPAKVYARSDERFDVALPPRRYEPLARLLLAVVDDLAAPDEAVAHAHSVGHRHGRALAAELVDGQGDGDAALDPEGLCVWLTTVGYGARLERAGGSRPALVVTNCVYHELARERADVVCAFDAGMFRGMLGVGDADLVQTHSLPNGDGFCRHELRL